MATIRKISWKKGDGSLSYGYQLTYMDGASRRHRKTFATKAAAEAGRVKIESELVGGRHVPDSATRSVRKGWDEWLRYMEGLQRVGKRERVTVRHYRTHFEKHISPLPIADINMNQITSAHIQEFVEGLESHLSHALAMKVYMTLRMLLAYCRRRRWLAQDPCEGIRLERPKRYDIQPVKIPPKEDIRKLLATAQEDIKGRSTAMLRLMVFRGLRISEVRGLPRKGLELDGKAPQLKILQRADDYCKIGPPKSHTSFRTLALSPEDVLALRKWLLAGGITDKPEALVFGTTSGTANSYQNLYYRWWIPLMKKAGLAMPVLDPKTKKPVIEKKAGKEKAMPDFTPHQLRHAFASLSIERGVSPKQLQVMMGHSSIKMTMDTYGHLWKDDEADQAMAIAIERQLG
jgi:site-specific recombinase XerD